MRYILFCGSRTWPSYTAILTEMRTLRTLIGDFTVIEGGARGADTFARIAAEFLDLPFHEELPDYERYSKWTAPKIRNTTMLDMQPEMVIAFLDGYSTGTLDCITKAVNNFRIPTVIRRISDGQEN